jgi:hypothetical protein
VNWTPTGITHAGGAPAQNYYVLRVVKDGMLYRSWYGNGDNVQCSVSTDLLSWSNDPDAVIPIDPEYRAGARDPYVFWDPDVHRWRLVTTAYRRNDADSMDVSTTLTTSTGPGTSSWGEQRDLVRYPNVAVPVSLRAEPEVSEFFKLGDRWYLVTSFLRESRHDVGRTVYFVGPPGATIDEIDWSDLPRRYLDGDDIAAAQFCTDGGRVLLMGWIPSDPLGNAWGGHLCLPREVDQQPDGTLTVRLAPEVSEGIRGDRLELAPPIGDSGRWSPTAAGIDYHGTGPGTALLGVRASSTDLEFEVTLAPGAERAGVLLGEQVEVVVDPNGLRVSSRQGIVYASVPRVAVDPPRPVKVRLVTEGDIVELFVDDRSSLAARVEVDLTGASIRLLAVGPAAFARLAAWRLVARVR